MMLHDPDQIWRDLSASKDRKGWMVRRLDPEAKVGLILGVHHPECLPSVLVEIQSRPNDEARDWPSTKGIEIGPERWGDSVGIRLTLTQPSLRSVFCALINDLVPLAAGEDSPRRVHARLDAWLALFSRRRAVGLDQDQQLALMSELEVMLRMSTIVPIPRLVHGWEGPLDDRGTGRGLHDFRLPGVRVEVKGTARVPSLSVTISRHAQLDPDAIGQDALLLVVACWSSGTTGTNTLPSMIHSIRTLVAPLPLAAMDLEDRLKAAGWLDAESHLYEDRSWTLLDLNWHEVLEGFPRLRCRDLPPGIIDGEYSISLQACSTWRCDEQAALRLVRSSDEYPT